MADVFISYASEDRARARAIAHALEERGWSVWWDRDIPVGGAYSDVIERELNAARCVIVLWSAESVKSAWVHNEAREGLARHVLAPATIDTVRAPLEFRHLHTAGLERWKPGSDEKEFEKLVMAVQTFAPVDVQRKPLAPLNPRAPKTQQRFLLIGSVVLIAVFVAIAVRSFNREPDANSAVDATKTSTVADTGIRSATDSSMTARPQEEQRLTGVGRLMVNETHRCTAFLISPTQAVTAKECVQGDGMMTLQLKQGNWPPQEYFFSANTSDEPYALLTLDRPAMSAFEPLELRTRRVRLGEEVLVAHFASDSDLIVSRVALRGVNTDGLTYGAPTRPGSMGAPVIAVSDRTVLGIHVGGGSTEKRAVLLPVVEPERVLPKPTTTSR